MYYIQDMVFAAFKPRFTEPPMPQSIREYNSEKPLKYTTQTFHTDDVVQNRGINFSGDGIGIPSSRINVDTSFRYGALTKEKSKTEHTFQRHLSTPGLFEGGQGNTDIEQSIRAMPSRVKKSCNPGEVNVYERHFAIFDTMPIKPMECVDNYVQKSHAFRGGISTRQMPSTKPIVKHSTFPKMTLLGKSTDSSLSMKKLK